MNHSRDRLLTAAVSVSHYNRYLAENLTSQLSRFSADILCQKICICLVDIIGLVTRVEY
jgi:hypothetical protein